MIHEHTISTAAEEHGNFFYRVISDLVHPDASSKNSDQNFEESESKNMNSEVIK